MCPPKTHHRELSLSSVKYANLSFHYHPSAFSNFCNGEVCENDEL